jgi:asparagine synthase (glutamine-hydrolysing)
VVLSGDGADEIFAGYPTYRASRVAEVVRRVAPRGWLDALGERAWERAAGREERLPPAALVGRFLLGAASPGHPHAEWRRLLPRHEQRGLYGPALVPLLGSDALAGYTGAVASAEGSLLDRCLLADQRFYLPSDMLMKVDAMSMAHGLEVRVPFLHPRIVDLAARLDGRVLTSWIGADKRVLRAALARLGAPQDVVGGSKLGFNVPVTRLLAGPLSDLASRLLDVEVERLTPWLAPEGVRRLWNEQRLGRGNHGYAIWALLTLAVWLEDTELTPE